MIRHKQFESIKVKTLQIPDETRLGHSHDYYEFVLIRSGTGKHHFKNAVAEFEAGDIFFITPDEMHSFLVDVPAIASVVSFNAGLKGLLQNYLTKWDLKTVLIAKARSPLNPSVRLRPADQKVASLIFDLLADLSNHATQNEHLILHQLVSLIVLIERNLSFLPQNEKSEVSSGLLIEKILKHIHKHLKQPALLTTAYLAKEFNISNSYVGSYFKRNTNIPLKTYIEECRMVMIARRIKHSDSSLSEIAYEFGFTDESHFLKSFRKYYGTSPSEFRQSYKSEPKSI